MLNLKNISTKKGLTQSDVATYLGIASPTYTRYENVELQPDNKPLKKIADYFDVSTDYLLGRE